MAVTVLPTMIHTLPPPHKLVDKEFILQQLAVAIATYTWGSVKQSLLELEVDMPNNVV